MSQIKRKKEKELQISLCLPGKLEKIKIPTLNTEIKLADLISSGRVPYPWDTMTKTLALAIYNAY